MTPESFNPQDYFPYGCYPWPNLVNANIEQMNIDMARWIDNDYTYLTELQKEQYKQMNFHSFVARMAPHASYEQVTPCSRAVLSFVLLDNQLKRSNQKDANRQMYRVIEILNGKDAEANDNGMFQHLAILRDEYRAFMPAEWMQRFTEGLYRCFKYGIEEESVFKINKLRPSIDYFMILREYSTNMYPYLYWADIETGFVLPKFIDEHPVIQRLRVLTSRIEAWQNDFYSLGKGTAAQSKVTNLIFVLQNAYHFSLKDACDEAKRIHDKDVAEFVGLHENLPNFGVYQEKVYDYITSLGAILQGINSYHINDAARYLLN